MTFHITQPLSPSLKLLIYDMLVADLGEEQANNVVENLGRSLRRAAIRARAAWSRDVFIAFTIGFLEGAVVNPSADAYIMDVPLSQDDH